MDRRSFIGYVAASTVAVAAHSRNQNNEPIVALLFDSLVSPFWVSSLDRMRREAMRRRWCVLEAISNLDDNKQYQQVQSMLQRRVDGIVIVHTDNKAVIPAIRAANASGVPMVHFNRAPASNDAYSVAVVADNRKLMTDTSAALVDLARRRGGRYQAAVLIGDLGDANAVSRRDGFQETLDRNRDLIDVVARIATDWNADKAFAGLSNALQAHPGINMLITSSDFMTPQIEQVLRAAGKWRPASDPGHVLIAGFDGDENGYRELAAGYFDVDGVQNLDYEVQLSFGALERMWRGEKPPKLLIDPGFVITRANLFAMRDQMWGYQAWKRSYGLARAGAAVGSTTVPVPDAAVNAQPLAGSAGHANSPIGSLGVTFLGTALLLAQVMFSGATLHDVLLAMLPLTILVVGQTPVLLVGQIDLSMTAVMALGSVVSASLMTRYAADLGGHWSTLVGIGTCLGLGLLVGLFNGVCNVVFRMPSFVLTLAVMMAGAGAAVWYASSVSDTVSIGGLPEPYRAIGYGTLFSIPIALIISALVVFAVWYMLSRTVVGRWIYAIGHNAKAARVSGVPIPAVTIAVFTASGGCAAIAAVIYTSRIEAALPTLGQNMLLDIVGSAVIGGVSLFGGRGSVLKALSGVLFLSVLDKSLQLLGLSLFLVLAIKGGAILVAAITDAVRRRPQVVA